MRARGGRHAVLPPVSGLGWGALARLALTALVLVMLWLAVGWSLR